MSKIFITLFFMPEILKNPNKTAFYVMHFSLIKNMFIALYNQIN